MTVRRVTPTVRRALPTVRAVGLGVGVVLTLAACSSAAGTPDVEVPAPAGEAAAACRALADELPDVVDGQERRPLDEETPYAAVWGSPGIVLRCGVPEPAQLDADSGEYDPTHADIVGVNEVSWLLEEVSGGKRFTTTERTVWVEMTVPEDYAPEVNPLLDVAAPIDRHIPLDELYRPDDEGAEGGAGAGDHEHHH